VQRTSGTCCARRAYCGGAHRCSSTPPGCVMLCPWSGRASDRSAPADAPGTGLGCKAELLRVEIIHADELQYPPVVIGEESRLLFAEQADAARLLDLCLRLQGTDAPGANAFHAQALLQRFGLLSELQGLLQ